MMLTCMRCSDPPWSLIFPQCVEIYQLRVCGISVFSFVQLLPHEHQHPRRTRCLLLSNRYSDSSLVSLGGTTTGRYVLDFAPTDRWPLSVRIELDEAEGISSHVSLFAVATLQLRNSEHGNFSGVATAEQI